MAELRATFDHAGAPQKVLVIVGDGSFCNRTVLSGIPDRVVSDRAYPQRCQPVLPCTRRGPPLLFQRQVHFPIRCASTKTISWQTTKIFYGGKRRKVRYKEVTGVLWQGGARKRPLRLFVLAATPYRKRKSGKALLPPSRLPADNCA